jgi:hypothetical protein
MTQNLKHWRKVVPDDPAVQIVPISVSSSTMFSTVIIYMVECQESFQTMVVGG